MTEVINFEAKEQIQNSHENIYNNNRSYIKIDPNKTENGNKFDDIKIHTNHLNMTNNTKAVYHTLLKDILSDDPMEYISIAKSAHITQLIDKNIFLAGCQPPIRYIVQLNTYLNEKKKVFQCREGHDWWQKNCYQ